MSRPAASSSLNMGRDDAPTARNFKSVALLQSGAFFLIFAAFNAAQSLAGVIPGPPNIASYQFAALYGTYTLLCIPAPKIVDWLGPKLSMVLGAVPYTLLVVSFLFPGYCHGGVVDHCWSEGTVTAVKLTAGALVGVGAPLLWTGQGIYLARAAAWSVQLGGGAETATSGTSLLGSIGLKERVGEANKEFNGLFFTLFQASGATGLCVSSLILTLVKGTEALPVLFIALASCCGCGIVALVCLLPALKAVPKDADDTEDKAEVTLFQTLELFFTDSRMYLLVPNVIYNGMSLGFIWFTYNAYVWGTGLGASFVGFGSAAFYLVNAACTQLTKIMAKKHGQMSVMTLATACHALFFLFFMFYDVDPALCDPEICAGTHHLSMNGTKPLPLYSCFKKGPPVNSSTTLTSLPCHGGTGPSCDTCEVFTAHTRNGGDRAQACGDGYAQCEWLHGNVLPPKAMAVVIFFAGAFVFALGDSVWEGQVPAILQTLFDSKSGKQESAMANLKLFQSLGITITFVIAANMDDIKKESLILLCTLVVSSLALVLAHFKVANLDTGKLRSEVGMYDDLA